MNSKRRVRSASGRGEDVAAFSSTSRSGRRYAVEQAIARARSAQPWHEVTVSPDSALKPLNQCKVEEEIDISSEEELDEN